MVEQGEAALVAVIGRGDDIARAAVAAWDAGEAVWPVDPGLPAAARDELFARLRPTHVLEQGERRALTGGAPVEGDISAVLVTSGTTGVPKAVELTRAGLEAMGHGYSDAVGASSTDRWLACLPLHHVAALAIVARSYVTGVPYTVHDRFELDAVARSPRDEGTTIVSLVPTTLRRLLDAGAPLHDYRCVVLGGAACPPALRARAEAVGATVFDAYGLTETWSGVVLDGVPNVGVEVRLAVDGELWIRGAMVMRRYRFAPEATAAAIDDDGWLRTGDLATISDGVVRVVDRKRDLVISGGVNVSPTRVEAVLETHPGVADVCVIGAPDDEWGERVVAVIVPKDGDDAPTLDALRTYARTHLRAADLPRELRVVSELPRSGGGKLLRRVLRD